MGLKLVPGPRRYLVQNLMLCIDTLARSHNSYCSLLLEAFFSAVVRSFNCPSPLKSTSSLSIDFHAHLLSAFWPHLDTWKSACQSRDLQYAGPSLLYLYSKLSSLHFYPTAVPEHIPHSLISHSGHTSQNGARLGIVPEAAWHPCSNWTPQ